MYLKHADLSRYWVVDIEADSLSPSKIWCQVALNCATKQVIKSRDYTSIREFYSKTHNDIYIGHNFLSFDAPALNRLLGTSIRVNQIVDTLVLSYLYNPHLERDHAVIARRGHSLKAWAVRMNLLVQKDEFNDFSKFSEELLERCTTDVEINYELFLRLTAKMRGIGYSEESCEIEHEIRHIINRQQRNGWFFNIHGAERLSRQFRQTESDLAEPIQRLFPPTLTPVKTFKYKERQDGTPYQSYLRHVNSYPEVRRLDGDYTCFDWQTFNIGSPKQRIQKLLDLGWVPTKFTKKGSPQVDEDGLLEAAQELGEPGLKAIAEWLVVNARGNMCETWLKWVNREDHRMHGNINSCGALSRRMTHNDPNTSNIPSNEAKYGKEMRGIWRPTPGLVMVGYDAKGIQMRLFGHFCDMYRKHREIYETYLGDPHTGNAALIGRGETRRNAKNHFYAFIFGAQPPKLGAMVGKDITFGRYVTEKLFEAAPGLKGATEDAKAEYKATGRLRCLDGGFVNCTGEHAAFNYQVQPAEAVVMKWSAIQLHKTLGQKGLEFKQIGFNHDEAQLECKREDADQIGQLACQSLVDAGEHFNLRVPMAGDYKVGTDWSQTH